MAFEEACEKLRGLLYEAIKQNIGDAILLSGGLDTSVVAVVAARFSKPKAYTVALKGAPAPDLEYAEIIAKKLGLNHTVHIFAQDELEEAFREVVKTLQTFDPMEIRNSAAIYVGFKLARRGGVSTVMTGDASDELLAGYSFVHQYQGGDLVQALKRIWRVMRFSSIPLAESLGMKAKLPYLHEAFKEFAMNLDPALLVGKRGDTVFGKWILRKAFEDQLPPEITWRVKTPIEYGCGTTILPKIYQEKISDADFESARKKILEKDGVTIRDKEHLAYYRLYHSIFGPPTPKDPHARSCLQCTTNVPLETNFCTTCGAYPV